MKPAMIICHENPAMLAGFGYLAESATTLKLIKCPTAEAALQSLKTSTASLLICSFSLPTMGALQLIIRAKTLSPKTKILVTGDDDSGFVAEKCIGSGASGYLTSTVSAAEFATAIGTVCKESIYTESRVAQKLALKNIRGSHHVFDSLSPREFDIFTKVIADKTAKEVAKELFLAEKTVANYISIIKKKLRTKTSAGLLRIGIKEGFSPELYQTPQTLNLENNVTSAG